MKSNIIDREFDRFSDVAGNTTVNVNVRKSALIDGLTAPNGKLYVDDKIIGQPSQANLTLSNVTPSIAKIGADNLANRSRLIVYNRTANRVIYWGFREDLSSTNSFTIPANSLLSIAVSDSTKVYLLAQDNGLIVTVAEAA